MARSRIRHPVEQPIEQHAVIQHRGLCRELRVRPIGAPDAALGCRLHEAARDGGQVGIGCGTGAIGADLHMRAAALDQAQCGRQLRAIRPVRGTHAGHMVQHQRHGQRRQTRRECHQRGTLHVKLDVPAEIRHAPRQGFELLHRRAIAADGVEPHADRTLLRHPAQLRRRGRVIHHDNRAGRFAELRDGIECDRIVSAIDAGLHHHLPREAQLAGHVAIMRYQSGWRRVGPRRTQREPPVGAEDVEMAVAGALGRAVARRLRDGMRGRAGEIEFHECEIAGFAWAAQSCGTAWDRDVRR